MAFDVWVKDDGVPSRGGWWVKDVNILLSEWNGGREFSPLGVAFWVGLGGWTEVCND